MIFIYIVILYLISYEYWSLDWSLDWKMFGLFIFLRCEKLNRLEFRLEFRLENVRSIIIYFYQKSLEYTQFLLKN